MAAEDFYLKIDTIKGESEATGFEEQMQIQSWSFGANNAGQGGLGTGLGSGKVSLQDFHFVIEMGKATVQNFLATCKGNHIPQAILSCRKTGGDGTPYVFFKVTFNDIVVSSYQMGGSAGGGNPIDQCSFNFTKITMEYFQQKADGTVSLTNTITYDTKKVEGSGA